MKRLVRLFRFVLLLTPLCLRADVEWDSVFSTAAPVENSFGIPILHHPTSPIAVYATGARTGDDDPYESIVAVRTDTGVVTRWLHSGEAFVTNGENAPKFSANGDYLVAMGADGSLWSVQTSSGMSTQLTSECESFAISGDGQYVAYVADGMAISRALAGGAEINLLPLAYRTGEGEALAIESTSGSGLFVMLLSKGVSTAVSTLYRVHGSGAGFTNLTTNTDSIGQWEVNSTGSHAVYRTRSSCMSVNLIGVPSEVVLYSGLTSYHRFDISPDGSNVAIVSSTSSPKNIQMVAITGGTPTDLITSNHPRYISDDFGIHFSKDGLYLYYFEYELCSVPTSGGSHLQLGVGGWGSYDPYLQLGYSNHHVLIYGSSYDHKLISVDMSDGTSTVLSQPSLSDAAIGTFLIAEDGQSVYYPNDELVAGQTDIFQVAVDGSTKIRVSTDALHEVSRMIESGDGTSIVGNSADTVMKFTVGVPESASLVSVNAPTNHLYKTFEKLSPDGEYIFFKTEVPDAESKILKCHLSLVSRASGSSIDLTDEPIYDLGDEYEMAQFTSDSQWIVFLKTDDYTSYYLINGFVAYRISDGLRIEIDDSLDNFETIFSNRNYFKITPSGDAVVYRDSSGKIYRFDLDGISTEPVQIGEYIGSVNSFTFSPAGDEILLNYYGHTSRIMLDGSESKIVSEESLSGVTYSADGSSIFYFIHDDLYKYLIADETVSLLATFPSPCEEITTTESGKLIIETVLGYYVVSPTDGSYLLLHNYDVGDAIIDGKTWVTCDGDSLFVFYAEDASGALGLYKVPMIGGTPALISRTLPVGGKITDVQVSPDETFLVYRADVNADQRFELFAVDVASGSDWRVNQLLTGAADVRSDWILASDNHVLYRADPTRAGFPRLYGVSFIDRQITDFTTPAWNPNSRVNGLFATSTDGQFAVVDGDPTGTLNHGLYSVWANPEIDTLPDREFLVGEYYLNDHFTISDLESGRDLTVALGTDNADLVDPSNTMHGRSGPYLEFTVFFEPSEWGLVNVTGVAYDEMGSSSSSFAIKVLPESNLSPTNILLAPASVMENQAPGTLVGYLNATDANAWDTFTYELVSGAGDANNASFFIAGNALKTTGPLDHEAGPVVSIRVRVTDFAEDTYEKNLHIQVQDQKGIPMNFKKSTGEGQSLVFSADDFIDHFTLTDGGALRSIRLDGMPIDGSLHHKLFRREIDTVANDISLAMAGDVNGDGRVDIVALNAGAGQLVWYENTGTSTSVFTKRIIANGLADPKDLVLTDIDADGDRDVVVAVHGDNKILGYRNSGGSMPSFVGFTVFSGAGGVSAVAALDVDNDGDRDIVSTHPLNHSVMIHSNDGMSPPGFVAAALSTTENGAADVMARDVDMDGDIDLVVAAATAGEVVWFEKVGPSFNRFSLVGGLNVPRSIDMADIDGDGRQDLVLGTEGDHTVRWFKNMPPASSGMPPTFLGHVISTTVGSVSRVRAADYTGDGVPDVLACAPVDGDIHLFRTFRGSPVTFTHDFLDRAADGVTSVDVADFNLNGMPDIVASHAGTDTLAWYEDERLLSASDEVDIDVMHRLRYQPRVGFSGIDSFGWSGDDGTGWSFLSASVNIRVFHSQYWDWLLDVFGEPVVTDVSQYDAVWSEIADPDRDGLNNLMEYAMGGIPTDPSDLGIPQQVWITDVAGESRSHLIHGARNDPHLVFTPEVSTDLTTWRRGPTALQAINPDQATAHPDLFLKTWRHTLPVDATTPSAFFRVVIEMLP